jgi:hypothetical protein
LKRRQKENAEREKKENIKLMDDYSDILDKQELDRANYFKSIADSQKNYMSKMADTVLKKQQDEQMEEERKMQEYQQRKKKK